MNYELVHRIYGYLFPRWAKNALERSIVELERFHKPKSAHTPPGTRALVLAPHPDDESIGCGGTVRKYVESGAKVWVAVLTDGRAGDPELRALPSDDPQRKRREDELVQRRKDETLAALEVLGVEEHCFLGAADGALDRHAAQIASRLADILSGWRPDIVLLPFLTDRHRDHFATNSCLLEAASRLDASWIESIGCMGYETWSPIYANLYVDITTVMEHKRKAVRCHQSQLRSNAFLAGIEGLNRFRAVSGLTGGDYAEGFFLAPLSTYRSLYRKLRL